MQTINCNYKNLNKHPWKCIDFPTVTNLEFNLAFAINSLSFAIHCLRYLLFSSSLILVQEKIWKLCFVCFVCTEILNVKIYFGWTLTDSDTWSWRKQEFAQKVQTKISNSGHITYLNLNSSAQHTQVNKKLLQIENGPSLLVSWEMKRLRIMILCMRILHFSIQLVLNNLQSTDNLREREHHLKHPS